MNLQLVSNWISEHLLAMGGSIAILVEFGLRVLPSQKPLGIAYSVSDGFKQVSDIFAKLGQFLDKVLPQRLK